MNTISYFVNKDLIIASLTTGFWALASIKGLKAQDEFIKAISLSVLSGVIDSVTQDMGTLCDALYLFKNDDVKPLKGNKKERLEDVKSTFGFGYIINDLSALKAIGCVTMGLLSIKLAYHPLYQDAPLNARLYRPIKTSELAAYLPMVSVASFFISRIVTLIHMYQGLKKDNEQSFGTHLKVLEDISWDKAWTVCTGNILLVALVITKRFKFIN